MRASAAGTAGHHFRDVARGSSRATGSPFPTVVTTVRGRPCPDYLARMSPRERARLTASSRLWTPSLLYRRAARSLAADREMPSLPAITEKGEGAGRYRKTWASAMVVDAALTRALAWLAAPAAISSAAAMVMRDSATDSPATSSTASTVAMSSAMASAAAWPAAAAIRPRRWRHNHLVGGRLFHQPGRDQSPDGVGGSGRLDPLHSATASAASAWAATTASTALASSAWAWATTSAASSIGGNLGSHHQPGLGGPEALADQRAAGLGYGAKQPGGPVVLDEQEGRAVPGSEIGQSPRPARSKAAARPPPAPDNRTAGRDGNHRRQEPEVFVVTDGQPSMVPSWLLATKSMSSRRRTPGRADDRPLPGSCPPNRRRG